MVLKEKMYLLYERRSEAYPYQKDSSIPLKVYFNVAFLKIGHHWSYGYNIKTIFNTCSCFDLTISFKLFKMNCSLLKMYVLYFKSTESV